MNSSFLIFLIINAITLVFSTGSSEDSSSSSSSSESCKYVPIGFSSGAYFTNLLHTIYSDNIDRAGMASGNLFIFGEAFSTFAEAASYLFGGNILDPITGLYSLQDLEDIKQEKYEDGLIDNPNNLKNDHVYLYAGTLDSGRLSMLEVLKYYEFILNNPKKQIYNNIDNLTCAHNWITDNSYGSSDITTDCTFSNNGFIANAGYDLAGKMLSYLINNKIQYRRKTNYDESNLKLVNVTSFIPSPYTIAEIDINPLWYVYTPRSCRKKTDKCTVVVVLHGCTMQGISFVKFSGFIEYADLNKILFVFPQMSPSATNFFFPCWDFFGYPANLVDVAFSNQNPRAATIHNYVMSLLDC